MNTIVLIMLIFWICGFADAVTGNHFKLGTGFTNGLNQLGNMILIILGFYCFSTVLVDHHIEALKQISSSMPMDLSVFTSMVLDTSMGGYPSAMEIASTTQLGLFTGILITSTVGCFICFQLPFILTYISQKDLPSMFSGIIPGILCVPPALLLGGIVLKVNLQTMLINMVPILIICAVLIAGVLKFPEKLQVFLTLFGKLVEVMAQGTSVYILLGLFVPALLPVPKEDVLNILEMTVKVTITMTGGMVFSEFILNFCRKPVQWCADQLNINESAMLGLILSLISPLIMFPLYSQMDSRGKYLNAAFLVVGSYVIGGQMAFVAEVSAGNGLTAFFVVKIVGGLLSLILSGLMFEKSKKPLSSCIQERD